MGNSRNSVKNSIEGISEMLEEIQKYSIEGIPVTRVRRAKIRTTKTITSNLDDRFWNLIAEEISRMLVQNINAIRVANKPEYAEWKKRARERGYTVQVLDDGTKSEVKYVRGGLLTGTLREKVRNVSVEERKKDSKSLRPDQIEYTIDFGNLKNRYNEYFESFVEKFGYKDIFALNEQQLSYILEKIASKATENL